MRDAVLAVDLGTGGARGALYSASAERLVSYAVGYPVERSRGGLIEQRPEDYCQAARQVIATLARRAAGEGRRIAALGFSTQTPTLVLADEEGRAVAPAILWQDTRAAEEAAWLDRDVAAERRRRWFGMDLPMSAAATPAKLLWMARRRPEIWRRTRWVMQPKDYVAAQLTGCFATDRWCAKGLADLATGLVHPELLALLDKPLSPSPPALSPQAVAGRVRPEAAAEWGLPAGTPVIAGWSDALAGVLAMGALHQERRGFVLAGTSEIIGLSLRGAPPADGLYLVPADLLDLHGLDLHFGPTQAGGDSLAWLARLLERSYEEIFAAVESRSGLTPVLFRPYLYGERAPYWDHTLSAGFEGLRGEHGPTDLIHAVLQGVALQERLVLECAERDRPAREVALAGGAARNAWWNRLRANVLQRPVLVLRDAEASLRGVALLCWGALEARALSEPDPAWFTAERILPEPEWAPAAEELMGRFRRI